MTSFASGASNDSTILCLLTFGFDPDFAMSYPPLKILP